jgi:hypothetical protein
MPGKLYAFDFDDNIAITDAQIRTTHGAYSTAAYATAAKASLVLRKDAFADFAKWRRCRIEPGPFFETFLRALDERAPVVVISARSHNQREFRALLKRVAALGGRRLNRNVRGFCVNNAGTRNLHGKTLSAAELKVRVLRRFLRGRPKSWSLGFSDDDPSYLRAMRRALRAESRTRRICIYDGRTRRKRVLSAA